MIIDDYVMHISSGDNFIIETAINLKSNHLFSLNSCLVINLNVVQKLFLIIE